MARLYRYSGDFRQLLFEADLLTCIRFLEATKWTFKDVDGSKWPISIEL